jgi:oligoendopeptidase F
MVATQTLPARRDVAVENTWDLSSLYPNETAWEQAIETLDKRIKEIATLEGKVGESSEALLTTLRLQDELTEQADRIQVYAALIRDVDTADSHGQGLYDRARALVTRFSAALAFIEPEILGIPEDTLTAWMGEEPGLQRYAFALEGVSRMRAHTRSAEVEAVLAQFGSITRTPGEIYGALNNADLKFPTIEGEDGKPIEITHGRYNLLRESKDRRVRQDTFKAYFGHYRTVLNTCGTALSGHVRTHMVNAKVRGFESSLHAALYPNRIPVEVYHNLLSTIDANLPKLHRYVSLRKRILGVDELRYSDMFAPLVPEVTVRYTYSEAAATVQEALKPLGAEYGSILEQAFGNRWIDVYENQGKRSGAYSWGTYRANPYILMNYTDTVDNMFTLAHELGHSLHSYFTWQTQPYRYGDYTTFLAEVASTLNESLLVKHLLSQTDDVALRKLLIQQQLDDIRSTIIRQTKFAAFEYETHRRAEAGEPLTAETFTEIYRDLLVRYYGPDMVWDDEAFLEWARIPHFYFNFYVFQYATGLSAALALSKQITSEGQPAVDRYLKFLSSGSSRPSVDILRDAGVDMTTPAPVQAAMDRFEELVTELEALS